MSITALTRDQARLRGIVLSSSGSFVPPDDIVRALVRGYGGGGGGAPANGGGAISGQGGYGALEGWHMIECVPGRTYNVTIGAGGAANSGVGGDTIIVDSVTSSELVRFKGGVGGLQSNSPVLNWNGTPSGMNSVKFSAGAAFSGATGGGGGPGGAGGNAGAGPGSGASAAFGSGAGGGGCFPQGGNAGFGGAGGSGLVQIFWVE